jgi:hypothetical protein
MWRRALMLKPARAAVESSPMLPVEIIPVVLKILTTDRPRTSRSSLTSFCERYRGCGIDRPRWWSGLLY